MREELDKKLCEDFPKLFSDRYGSMSKTAMCWGFSCGDGWYNLIRECCAVIESVNDKIEDPENWVRASQVKEKFGTLRFYVGGVPEEFADTVHHAIDEAERKSEITCETCGAPGKTTSKGWLRTSCMNHEND